MYDYPFLVSGTRCISTSYEALSSKLNLISNKGDVLALYYATIFFSLGSEIERVIQVVVLLSLRAPNIWFYFLRKLRNERGSGIHRLSTWGGFAVRDFGLPCVNSKL